MEYSALVKELDSKSFRNFGKVSIKGITAAKGTNNTAAQASSDMAKYGILRI